MRNYAGTCKVINVQLQCSVYLFDILFAIKKFSFCGVLFNRILAWERGISKRQYLEGNCSFPCNLFIAIQYMQGCENMFLLVSLSKSKFFTRVALVSFVQYSCRTRVVSVALVSHSCQTCVALVSPVSQSCRTRVAFVSLVSHSCRSCLALGLLIRLDQKKLLQLVLGNNQATLKEQGFLPLSLQLTKTFT